MYNTSRRVATKMYKHLFLCVVKFYDENETCLFTFFFVAEFCYILLQGKVEPRNKPKN